MDSAAAKDAADARIGQAFDLIRRGSFAEAEPLCRELRETLPERGESFWLQALVDRAQGRNDEALDWLIVATRVDPNLAEPHRDLIQTCFDLDLNEAAGRAIEHARAEHPEAGWLHLLDARLRLKLGDRQGAEAVCAMALEYDDDRVAAHMMLGWLLYERGALEAAAEHLLAARAAEPATPDPHNILARTLFLLDRANELDRLQPPSDPTQRYGEATFLAIHAWQKNDLEKLRPLMERCRALAKDAGQTQNRLLFDSTIEYLDHLLAWREDHLAVYQGEVEEPLFMIGDNHCLSAAHLVGELDGKSWLVIPRFVPEAKAWDFARPEANPVRSTVELLFRQLPPGTTVLVSFGKADCRLTDGIARHVRRNPELVPEEVTESLVGSYVARIAEMASDGNHRVIFGNQPASLVLTTLVHNRDRVLYHRIRRSFNASLRRAARAAGCRVLDLASATTRSDGEARANLFIQRIGLAPEAFRVALGLGVV